MRLSQITAANIGPNRLYHKLDCLVADVDPGLSQQILTLRSHNRYLSFSIITTRR
jgi:hypothetical protein